jgi:hypothetical protein
MIKNLVVCGDSFNTISDIEEYKGTHWSEILSKYLNLNLISLADAGSSTTRIVFQMLEALTIPDSFVICAPTIGTERVEIVNNINYISYPVNSLKNFKPKKNNSYYSYAGFLKSASFSDNEYPVLAKYLSSGIIENQSKWGYLYAIKKLKDNKIPFLLFEGFILPTWHFIKVEEYLEYISLDEIILLSEFDAFGDYINCFNDASKEKRDPGYHTFPDQQLKIAEYVFNKIKSKIIKGNR